jgi:hypothetical protein
MNKTEEIYMEEAIKSWFDTVYMPVVYAIEKSRIMKYFKKNTISELYVFIINFFDDLKKKFGDEIQLDEIIYGIKEERKAPILKKMRNILKKMKFKLTSARKK